MTISSICGHSNGNFPEGQALTNRQTMNSVRYLRKTFWLYFKCVKSHCLINSNYESHSIVFKFKGKKLTRNNFTSHIIHSEEKLFRNMKYPKILNLKSKNDFLLTTMSKISNKSSNIRIRYLEYCNYV